MSIILDALRKSERERRLGQIPTLESTVSVPRSAHRFGTRATVAVLSLVLLATGAYLWTRRHAETDAATAPAVSAVSAAPQGATAAMLTVSAPVHNDARPAGGGNELPAALRGRTPPLVLNALSWSEEAKRRFAMINQAIVREGQALPGGVMLHEITREGAVLEFQGQRFTLRP